MTDEDKAAIDAAAKSLGVSTSAFVLEAAMEKSLRIRQPAESIQLSIEEQHRFLLALDNSPEPAKKLKQLFKKYSEKFR